jgi:hypothetical protein
LKNVLEKIKVKNINNNNEKGKKGYKGIYEIQIALDFCPMVMVEY